MNDPVDVQWRKVRELHKEAGDYARKGDMLAAALLDAEASRLADRLREHSQGAT